MTQNYTNYGESKYGERFNLITFKLSFINKFLQTQTNAKKAFNTLFSKSFQSLKSSIVKRVKFTIFIASAFLQSNIRAKSV